MPSFYECKKEVEESLEVYLTTLEPGTNKLLAVLNLTEKNPVLFEDLMAYGVIDPHHFLRKMISECSNDVFLSKSEILLSYNANINATNSKGESILSKALRLHKPVKIIDFLLKKGADPNKENHHDAVPLQIAVRNKEVSIISLLLERGANPYRRDKASGKGILHDCIDDFCTGKLSYDIFIKVTQTLFDTTQKNERRHISYVLSLWGREHDVLFPSKPVHLIYFYVGSRFAGRKNNHVLSLPEYFIKKIKKKNGYKDTESLCGIIVPYLMNAARLKFSPPRKH